MKEYKILFNEQSRTLDSYYYKKQFNQEEIRITKHMINKFMFSKEDELLIMKRFIEKSDKHYPYENCFHLKHTFYDYMIKGEHKQRLRLNRQMKICGDII